MTRKLDDLESKTLKQESELQKRSTDASLDEEKDRAVEALRRAAEEAELRAREQQHEMQELKSKLAVREAENAELKRDLEGKSGRLEMAEVNLAQLRSVAVTGAAAATAAADESDLAEARAKVEELTMREAELTAYIQQASQDREQIIHQYTTYSQQLTAQIESLGVQLSAKTTEASQLSTREAQLVAHVEQLEGQLQQLLARSKSEEREVVEAKEEKKAEPSQVDLKETEMLRSKVAEVDQRLTEVIAERDEAQGKWQEKVSVDHFGQKNNC